MPASWSDFAAELFSVLPATPPSASKQSFAENLATLTQMLEDLERTKLVVICHPDDQPRLERALADGGLEHRFRIQASPLSPVGAFYVADPSALPLDLDSIRNTARTAAT